MSDAVPDTIGNRLAPPRFILFVLLLLAAAPAAIALLDDWQLGTMVGFDLAAFVFLATCLPMLRVGASSDMCANALANDANRAVLLAITALVSLAILATIAAQLTDGEPLRTETKAIVIATLLLAWLFSNTVYALHYAHLAYMLGSGERSAGLEFPGTKDPVYADFAYFAFTVGMTFQTSDVVITDDSIRRVVTLHSLAAFIFNIGVLAFTINVLGR